MRITNFYSIMATILATNFGKPQTTALNKKNHEFYKVTVVSAVSDYQRNFRKKEHHTNTKNMLINLVEEEIELVISNKCASIYELRLTKFMYKFKYENKNEFFSERIKTFNRKFYQNNKIVEEGGIIFDYNINKKLIPDGIEYLFKIKYIECDLGVLNFSLKVQIKKKYGVCFIQAFFNNIFFVSFEYINDVDCSEQLFNLVGICDINEIYNSLTHVRSKNDEKVKKAFFEEIIAFMFKCCIEDYGLRTTFITAKNDVKTIKCHIEEIDEKNWDYKKCISFNVVNNELSFSNLDTSKNNIVILFTENNVYVVEFLHSIARNLILKLNNVKIEFTLNKCDSLSITYINDEEIIGYYNFKFIQRNYFVLHHDTLEVEHFDEVAEIIVKVKKGYLDDEIKEIEISEGGLCFFFSGSFNANIIKNKPEFSEVSQISKETLETNSFDSGSSSAVTIKNKPGFSEVSQISKETLETKMKIIRSIFLRDITMIQFLNYDYKEENLINSEQNTSLFNAIKIVLFKNGNLSIGMFNKNSPKLVLYRNYKCFSSVEKLIGNFINKIETVMIYLNYTKNVENFVQFLERVEGCKIYCFKCEDDILYNNFERVIQKIKTMKTCAIYTNTLFSERRENETQWVIDQMELWGLIVTLYPLNELNEQINVSS